MSLVYTVLAVDITRSSLVSFLGSVDQIPQFFQRGKLPIALVFVRPNQSQIPGGASFVLLNQSDLGSFNPRLTISQYATGTSGDDNALALAKLREGDFTWANTINGVSGLNGFTALLNCNTTAMETYIGSLDSKTAQFNISATQDGSLRPIFQTIRDGVTVVAVDDEGSDAPMNMNDSNPIFTKLFLKNTTTGHIIMLALGDDDTFTPTPVNY